MLVAVPILVCFVWDCSLAWFVKVARWSIGDASGHLVAVWLPFRYRVVVIACVQAH